MQGQKKHKKGFVISWFYPPINSSEGMVTYKLLKNSKYHYTVFTQNDDEAWSYGSNGGKEDNNLRSDNVDTVFGTSESFDAWINECVEYFRKHRDEYSFIMSRAMPPESHLAAKKIKAIFPDIVWVASFGDPVVESPYHMKGVSIPGSGFKESKVYKSARVIVFPLLLLLRLGHYSKRAIKFVLHGNDSKREIQEYGETLEQADSIILNNSYQKEYMMRGQSDKITRKVSIVPHSYDLELYPRKVAREKGRQLIFSFFGQLDDIRSARPLLMAINRLRKEKSTLFERVLFNFYGNMGSDDKVYIVDNDLTSIVKLRKPLSYTDSLRGMKESDWLFLIDADLGNVLQANIYFASKLVDYLGSGKQIMAITMIEGISADIVRDAGGVVTSRSADDIYLYLSKIICESFSVKMRGGEKFESGRVAKLFDSKISELLG